MLAHWKNEAYAVLGAREPFAIERSGSVLFGMVIQGAHLTVYTDTPQGLKIWVPRRASTRSQYPLKLDNTVAGGIAAGESPLECIAREATEEANLPEQLVLDNAVALEPLKWFHRASERGRTDGALLVPCVSYVFELEVGADVQPEAVKGEMEELYLWDVKQVIDAIRRDDFKPSCAMVLMDFLIRHGFITAESEKEFDLIVSRLPRRLPFAGC